MTVPAKNFKGKQLKKSLSLELLFWNVDLAIPMHCGLGMHPAVLQYLVFNAFLNCDKQIIPLLTDSAVAGPVTFV